MRDVNALTYIEFCIKLENAVETFIMHFPYAPRKLSVNNGRILVFDKENNNENIYKY